MYPNHASPLLHYMARTLLLAFVLLASLVVCSPSAMAAPDWTNFRKIRLHIKLRQRQAKSC
jgi:hypothetical protein